MAAAAGYANNTSNISFMPDHPYPPDFLVLRSIQPGDEEALHAIFASTREAERQQFGGGTPEWDAFTRQQFAAQHAQYMHGYTNPTFSIVLRGGQAQIAGRLYVDRTPAEIRIVDIALLPAHRRQGLGGRLLRALADESDASGIPLGLHVEKNNPILSAYERMRFQVQSDRGVYLYLQRPPAQPPDMEDLAAQAGTDFQLSLPGGDGSLLATLRLQEAAHRQGAHGPGWSLRFTGPDVGRSAHATYTLAHPRLGRFPLFLGPVMDGAAGEMCYQAIVTRRTPPTPKEPIP